MTTLITDNNLAVPDEFYESLLAAHQELTTPQSHAMNAALVLLLANHIGDSTVIHEALKHAHHVALQTDTPAGTTATTSTKT